MHMYTFYCTVGSFFWSGSFRLTMFIRRHLIKLECWHSNYSQALYCLWMTCYFKWNKVLSTEVEFRHSAMQIWTERHLGSWITVVEPRISSQPVLIRVASFIRYPANTNKSVSLAHTNWSYLLYLPVTKTYLSPCANWLPCGLTARWYTYWHDTILKCFISELQVVILDVRI